MSQRGRRGKRPVRENSSLFSLNLLYTYVKSKTNVCVLPILFPFLLLKMCYSMKMKKKGVEKIVSAF